jgi:AcrR family transcriptional regulator
VATDPAYHNSALPADDSTRNRLAECALSLFAAKGYEATSVREIIGAAGVTRPVLYYHFKNKADLFCYLVETLFERSFREMDAILAAHSGCRARLKALIHNEFASAQRSPDSVRFLLRYFFAPPEESMRLDSEALAQERFVRIVRIMSDGLASGELGGGDAGALALAFSGFMDLHVMAKGRHPEMALQPDLGDALVDLFIDGAAEGSSGLVALQPFLGEAYGRRVANRMGESSGAKRKT